MAHNTAQSSDNDEEVSAITEPREPTLTTIIPITRCGDPEDNPVPFTRQTEEKPAPAPKREPAPAPQKASPPPGWPRSGPVPPRTPAGGLQRSGSLRRSSNNNTNSNNSSTGSSSLARSSSLRVKRPEGGEAKARVPQSPATARRTAAASSAKLQRTPSLRRKAETSNNNNISNSNNNNSGNNNNSNREADKEDKPFVRKLHTRESLRRRAREAADKASVEKEEPSSASTPAGPVNTAPIPIRRLTNNNRLHFFILLNRLVLTPLNIASIW